MSDRPRWPNLTTMPALIGLASGLADALQDVPPELGMRERMRARILAACGDTARRQSSADPTRAVQVKAGTTVQRSTDGAWLPVFPGVHIRHLSIDRDAGVQLALWRLDPGATIPQHTHRLTEECLVVEGGILHAGSAYGAGDFLLAAAGSPHEVFESPSGALLLIRGELPPSRLVAAPAILASVDD